MACCPQQQYGAHELQQPAMAGYAAQDAALAPPPAEMPIAIPDQGERLEAPPSTPSAVGLPTWVRASLHLPEALDLNPECAHHFPACSQAMPLVRGRSHMYTKLPAAIPLCSPLSTTGPHEPKIVGTRLSPRSTWSGFWLHCRHACGRGRRRGRTAAVPSEP